MRNTGGRTSISGVAASIKNAEALVTNSTGVAHIAAAVKKKSLVLSLNKEPVQVCLQLFSSFSF